MRRSRLSRKSKGGPKSIMSKDEMSDGHMDLGRGKEDILDDLPF
jgi:hypothetical protein